MSLHQQECLQLLEEMKSFCPERQTLGISSTEIQEFLLVDPRLSLAIQNAYQNFLTLKQELPNLLSLSEKKLIEHLQEGYCNFYGVDALKPYVPLAAEGPWMITAAVLLFLMSADMACSVLATMLLPFRTLLKRNKLWQIL
jgi:hypothetical protein